ncbi:MAG: selenium-binding family protein, partial [Candidatus Thiodiazotropha sp. (ex Lucinoma kastoroae)]|nr:selenium-binding family protein [Candidatus Thiodiazotropha sp. (ex Lucinoma kastoroae)]
MRLFKIKPVKPAALASAIALTMTLSGAVLPVHADETCQSPYMAKITGQEDFVYVWTLGVEGLGDGQDKLVTVDVNPKSDHYG